MNNNTGDIMSYYKYKIRTDLAFQNKLLKTSKTSKHKNIKIISSQLDKFNFTSIIFPNLETKENETNLKLILKKELHKYLKKYYLNDNSSVLIIGLGNSDITSDSLGIKTLNYITATGHLKNLNISKRIIYKFCPNVNSNTGISSSCSIKSLKRALKPDFIIVIDSLISGSITYLNKLIQISDRGIIPGSGVGNYQSEISIKTLKIPVIAIGIPTAIEASTIIKDALNLDTNEITFKKGYDLIVSTKNIDYEISKLSKFLGECLNEFL